MSSHSRNRKEHEELLGDNFWGILQAHVTPLMKLHTENIWSEGKEWYALAKSESLWKWDSKTTAPFTLGDIFGGNITGLRKGSIFLTGK